MDIIYVIKSKNIDRNFLKMEIDALCDADGYPMCWLDIDSVLDYMNDNLSQEEFYIDSINAYKWIKDINDFSMECEIKFRITIMN